MNARVPQIHPLLTLGFAATLACLQIANAQEDRPVSNGTPHQLVFHNGDHLTGNLQGLDSSLGTLTWAYPEASAPFQFDLSTVSHLVLQGSATVTDHDRPQFRLTLVNGDTLIGAILRLDEHQLSFDIGLEAPLDLPRQHLHRLEAAITPAQLLYDGPREANEWTVGYRGKNWQFEDGHLISESYSSTGRSLTIPNRARIELDVTLQEDPTLNMFLCADNPRNGGDSYYYFQLTPNIINFQRYWRDHPRTYINLTREYENQAAKERILDQAQLHLAFEIDRSSKRVRLFINGEHYADYRDPAPQAPTGSSMILASYGNGAVRAHSIRVYALEQLSNQQDALPAGSTLWQGGSTVNGPLMINEEGQAMVEGEAKAVGELLVASFAPRAVASSATSPTVYLASGATLGGDASLEASTMTLQHSLLGEVSLSTQTLEGLVFPSRPPTPAKDRVTFKNGDRLGGKLVGWDREKGLHWGVPGHEGPLTFPTNAAAEIRLGEPSLLPATSCNVRLDSGDHLPGQLQSLTETSLALITPFSEPLTLPLAAVRSLTMHPPEDGLFRGPGKLSEWQAFGTPGTWRPHLDEGFWADGTGGIGRSVPLPDRGRLDIELSWNGQLELSLTWFAQSLDRTVQPRSYRLHCENEKAALYRGLTQEEATQDRPDDDPLRNKRLTEQLERFSAQFGGGPTRRLGSPVAVTYRAFRRTRTYSLCWDRTQATLTLLVDGEALRTWEDPGGLVPPSNGLVVYQHHPSSSLHFRSMRIRQWNGMVPDPPLNPQTAKQLTKPLMRLRNQDALEVESLALESPESPLAFASPLGGLALPLDRVESLHFPSQKFPVAHQLGMVIDGQLHPHGRCRFFLSQIQQDKLSVESPYFGANTFDLAAFRLLKFDLQDRPYWDRKGFTWPSHIPVTMRSVVRQRRPDANASSAPNAVSDPARFNESVELDE